MKKVKVSSTVWSNRVQKCVSCNKNTPKHEPLCHKCQSFALKYFKCSPSNECCFKAR